MIVSNSGAAHRIVAIALNAAVLTYVFFLKVIKDFQIKKYPATSCGGRHLVGNWLRASSPAQRPSPAGEGRWLFHKMDNLFVGNPLMCRRPMICLFNY